MRDKTFYTTVILIYLCINFIYDISTFIHIKTLNSEDCGTKKYVEESLLKWINCWYVMSFVSSSIIFIWTILYIFNEDVYNFKIINTIKYTYNDTTYKYLQCILTAHIVFSIYKTFRLIDGGLIIFGNSFGDDSCFYKTRALWDWCLFTFILYAINLFINLICFISIIISYYINNNTLILYDGIFIRMEHYNVSKPQTLPTNSDVANIV